MKNKYQTPVFIIRKMIENGDLGEFIGKSYKDKKALGGVLSAASTLVPMLGNIGSLLKGTQSGHPTRENVNPYGYQNGGPTDPPIKRQEMARSTTNVNRPLPLYGDEVRKLPPLTQEQIDKTNISPEDVIRINEGREKSNANIDKYGWEGKPLLKRLSYALGGYKQYNANSHEMGGQTIDERGNPNPNGNAEIEGQENLFSYRNIPRKSDYIFSDKNGTSELVRNVINKKTRLNPDLDEPTRNMMELQIQEVENLNESINSLRENVQQVFQSGGPLDPLPTNPKPLSTDLDNPQLSNIQFAPGFTYPTDNKRELPGLDEMLRGTGLALNATQLFKKAENEDLITPDYNKSDQRFNRLNANLDAARDEVLSNQNASSQAIRSGSQSFQSLISRELQNQANTNRALNNVSLQEQQLRNQIDQTVGSYEASKAQDIANREYQNRVDNLQNEAVNRNIKRGVIGDVVAEADRLSTIKNNARIAAASVAETQAILNQLYPDFEINSEWINKAKQLALGEINEEEYNKYVQTQSAIKFKG